MEWKVIEKELIGTNLRTDFTQITKGKGKGQG